MIEINKTHYGLQTHQSKRENTPKQNPKLYLTGKLIKKKIRKLTGNRVWERPVSDGGKKKSQSGPNFWAFLYSQRQQLKMQKIADHKLKLNSQTEKHRRINPKIFKCT